MIKKRIFRKELPRSKIKSLKRSNEQRGRLIRERTLINRKDIRVMIITTGNLKTMTKIITTKNIIEGIIMTNISPETIIVSII